MNTKVEQLEGNIVKLEITVEKEAFNAAMQKAYKKNLKNFNIPGFRKGKVPMAMVKRYYGESFLYEDAINFCCDDTYPKAIEENSISPVDYPKIDIVQIGEGKDLIYTAEVVVKPEVKLGEYKGIEVKKVSYPVTDELIENEIKAIQNKNARVIDNNEKEVENGDTAVIDFKGFVDGEAFAGGEGNDFSLEIGSGSFIDNFEEQLIGAKVGEEKEVNVTFPENYGSEELNGKPALFKVSVKGIKTKELPSLDDEFAQDVSEFDTFEEFKSDLRTKKEKENSEKEKVEYEAAALDLVTDNSEVDIPEVMVKGEIDGMVKDFETRLSYQGLDLKTYLQYTNSSEEKLRELMKENAERKVKTELVLEAIIKAENIEATDEEIKAKAEEMAKRYTDGDSAALAEQLMGAQKHMMSMQVVNEKVIELIISNAKEIA
ncbi:trigger factor [Clostridium grantii]|uniref:Trigger factor n=1 Tax=Clostridium grantii DSM 8605 TaxID=1121316 RepID=A0A1M5WB89_9CLOT|nr:trigger factor [Clostridium grantii]SHH84756.1 trigger factor [Clostridium grantii DSM 8605]